MTLKPVKCHRRLNTASPCRARTAGTGPVIGYPACARLSFVRIADSPTKAMCAGLTDSPIGAPCMTPALRYAPHAAGAPPMPPAPGSRVNYKNPSAVGAICRRVQPLPFQNNGAEGGTRTPTRLPSLRPERSASTNSTTSAFRVESRKVLAVKKQAKCHQLLIKPLPTSKAPE